VLLPISWRLIISAIVGLANIGILTAMLAIYAKVYRNTKAIFIIARKHIYIFNTSKTK
jgi:hypothetical protein